MKRAKRTMISVLLALAFILMGMMPVFAEQDGPDVFAAGYCVMNGDTGEIIFQKDMEARMYPASITKIMTALVVLEQCSGRLDEQLTFSSYAVDSLTANSSTLNPKASVGEVMTVRDALYGMMLCSANECANALAEYTAGSVEQFSVLMNQKAQEIGAVNTHFVNPHGLHDENHYTTPYDMAKIFQAAMNNGDFETLDTTIHYTIPATNVNAERPCTMSHQLINGTIPFEGVYGGKTGNTAEAGRTLVTGAKRYGVDLIVVIMKSDNDRFYLDTEVLMEYGFGKVSGSYPGLVYTPVDDTVYASGEVRIREFPSTYARQVASVAAGDALHRVGTYAGWSQVEIAGGRYYISTDFLLNESGAAVAAPYATVAPTEATAAPSTEALTTPPAETSQDVSTEAEQQTLEETPAEAAEQTPEQSHSYEVNEEVLTVVILVIITIIAILAGVFVALLIMRRA